MPCLGNVGIDDREEYQEQVVALLTCPQLCQALLQRECPRGRSPRQPRRRPLPRAA